MAYLMIEATKAGQDWQFEVLNDKTAHQVMLDHYSYSWGGTYPPVGNQLYEQHADGSVDACANGMVFKLIHLPESRIRCSVINGRITLEATNDLGRQDAGYYCSNCCRQIPVKGLSEEDMDVVNATLKRAAADRWVAYVKAHREEKNRPPQNAVLLRVNGGMTHIRATLSNLEGRTADVAAIPASMLCREGKFFVVMLQRGFNMTYFKTSTEGPWMNVKNFKFFDDDGTEIHINELIRQAANDVACLN